MKRGTLFRSGLSVLALGVASVVGATTPHTLTVDGDLGDFAADEKTAGDPLGDSIYGAENDLGGLYVSWDTQKLYLGAEYKAEQSAVMLLVDTGQAGGVTSFCASSGYGGAFPANLQSTAGFDLMVAFFAPADHGQAPAPYVFKLAAANSTDITAAPGVAASIKETVSSSGRSGTLEAAIPWDSIYGLGAGKVPPGATLKLAVVLRGKNDDDGLGDASPDPSGGVKNVACGGGAGTQQDKFHLVTVDASGDGVPDPGWAPGPNQPKVDAGSLPDSKPPAPDLPVVQKDQSPLALDHKPVLPDKQAAVGDQPALPAEQGAGSEAAVLGDKGGAAGDRSTPGKEGGGKPQEEGCGCQAGGAPGGWLFSLASALVLFLFARRRRR